MATRPSSGGAVLLATLALLTWTGSASAQVAWDAPSLMAPGAPAGWGIHLVDGDPGDELGVFAAWRGAPAPVGLGFRVGLAEGRQDDLAIFGGLDVSGALHRGRGEVPLDVIWFAGAGAGIDDGVLLSFPGGISLGWAFQEDQVAFRPYVAPKIVLDAFLDDEVDDDLELGAALEIGLDLAFRQGWGIRAGASVGDRDAVSVGVQFGG